MTYSTLQIGSSGADVMTLKRLLNSAGYQLDETDVFDEETGKAVSSYQTANRLTATGKADAPTWAKLAANAVTAMPKDMGTQETVRYLEENRPAAYSSGYSEQLDSLLKQVNERKAFSYDPAEDELYKRYRDQYLYLGNRAMNDARGSAATLTGGYDNTYAESAGQQAYQNYLSQISGKIPDLYQLALSAYDAETGRLADSLEALTGAEKTAYERYKDDMDQYAEALRYYYQKMLDEQEQANWLMKNESSGHSSGGSKPTEEEIEEQKKEEEKKETAKAVAIQKEIPNILTLSEFNRRKAQNASNVSAYKTYAEYTAAMKKKYGI